MAVTPLRRLCRNTLNIIRADGKVNVKKEIFMRKTLLILFCIIVSCSLVTVNSIAQDNEKDKYEKKDIVTKEGKKIQVKINKKTKMPHRIYGMQTEFVKKYGIITEYNIEQSSRKFLKEYEDVFQVNQNDLVLDRATTNKGRWFVNFQQVYKKIPVWRAYVGFTVNRDGSILLAGSDAYPNIKINAKAALSEKEAVENAAKNFLETSQSDGYRAGDKAELIILPADKDDDIEYFLTYKVIINSPETFSGLSETYFVDAQTGEILKKYSNGREFSDKDKNKKTDKKKSTLATLMFTSYLKYWDTDPNGTEYSIPAGGAYWKLYDMQYDFTEEADQANDSGELMFPNIDTGDYIVRADTLYGTHVTVYDDQNRWAPESGTTLSAPGNYTVYRGPDAGTQVYYHVTNAYNIFTSSPFNLSSMWSNMPVNVSYSPAIPGKSYGTSLAFGYQVSQNWGVASDVIYHEYTHSVIYNIYGGFIGTGYSANHQSKALDEGLADFFSAHITNDSEIMDYFAGYGRDVDNTLTMSSYDNSAGADPHLNGRIFSGACWDLREGALGESYASELVFDALQITPQAYNFPDFADNIFLADDLDNDLSTSVPHYTPISSAFSNHTISFSAVGFPGAVTSLSVSNSNNGTYLSWASASDVVEYAIYRKTTGAYSLLIRTPLNYHTDTSVSEGTFYTYKVIAENNAGGGTSSPEDTVSVPANISVNVTYDYAPSYYDWVTFTATATGGIGTKSYTWYRAPENDPDNWTQVGSNSSSLYLKCTVWGFYLKVVVEDDTSIADGEWSDDYSMAKRAQEWTIPEIPEKFELFNNYPNPFNPETTIRYSLPENGQVTVQIFDLNGKHVKTLVNRFCEAGSYTINWNGKNESGLAAASGVYIYKISAGKYKAGKKMVLLK